MKIYLAARYIRRDELRGYAKKLRELGYIVTSRWLRETKDPVSTVADVTEAEHIRIAKRDLKDVARADMFVCFNNEAGMKKRGGHHVELGYALALGKKIVVLEGEENTFNYLPEIVKCDDFEWFLKFLEGKYGAK